MNRIKQLVSIIVISVFIFLAYASGEDGAGTSTSETPQDKIVKVGEILTTNHFEVQVNKVSIKDRVSTGNEFANIASEEGNQFLIFNITFKNIDNESRTFFEGEVIINSGGTDYKFDKSEMVMLDGWGSFLDQLNPLTSKSTNLVFKIPTEIKGDVYWKPGRNSAGKMFLLTNIE